MFTEPSLRTGPRLYFDRNVFSMITEKREGAAVRACLEEYDASLFASITHLQEKNRIIDESERALEFKTFLECCTHGIHSPEGWDLGREYLDALYRRGSNHLYPHAGAIELPYGESNDYIWLGMSDGDTENFRLGEEHDQIVIAAKAINKKFQKLMRAAYVKKDFSASIKRIDGRTINIDSSDPEEFWRADNVVMWSNALGGYEASSGMRYFVLPYIRDPSAYARSDEFADFWLKEVSALEVPKSRLGALIDFYQARHKYESGHTLDGNHAKYALDVDHFFSADKAFVEVLVNASRHFSSFAKIHEVDRNAPSFVTQLRKLLASMPTSRLSGNAALDQKSFSRTYVEKSGPLDRSLFVSNIGLDVWQ